MFKSNKYPEWRGAIERFQQEDFKEGDIIPFVWLYESFDIKIPDKSTSYEDGQKAQLQFVKQFDKFQESMLKDGNVALKSVRSEGYKVIPSKEQTEWAVDSGLADIGKALKKAKKRLIYTDLTKLTDREKKENNDAIAKFAGLRSMTRDVKRGLLPRPE